MKIAVITVNYHNEEETIACIKSFNKVNKGKHEADVYVVDNDGSANSQSRLKKSLPSTRHILSRKNIGFAGGNNLAITEALDSGADYILLINPDCLVDSKTFLLDMLSVRADIVAPIIRYKRDGEIAYDFGGKTDYLFGRNTHLISHSKDRPSAKPDYFTGACLLIKSEVFRKIGMLDDGFFLYYEDADFCLRAVKAGFTQKLCAKATLIHYLSTTTSKLGKKKIKILADSHLRFCLRHLPVFSAPFYLFFNLYLKVKNTIS